MKIARLLAWTVIGCVLACVTLPRVLTTSDYARQFREHASEGPSARFPLGTDELGRDRLARLLHGTRVSLALAPAAAALAASVALAMGVAAASQLPVLPGSVTALTDVLASVPTLFLLIGARAALPLDMPPLVSALVTFATLGLLGWTSGSRVVRASVVNIRGSSWLMQARATGSRPWRRTLRHVIPALAPAVSAVFWTSIPLFLIAEANLGLLGLGVTEPMPSLGGLLADLQNFHDLPATPWRLAPAVVLTVVVIAVQTVAGTAQERK